MKKIVVAEGGWVFIGEVVDESDGKVRMTKASVVRSWGTTAGLGEIALNGPTSKTVLDYAGAVEVHKVICTYECKK